MNAQQIVEERIDDGKRGKLENRNAEHFIYLGIKQSIKKENRSEYGKNNDLQQYNNKYNVKKIREKIQQL
jgi:hypothetical protein